MKMALEAGQPELAEAINKAYPESVLKECVAHSSAHEIDSVRKALEECRRFLSSLLMYYRSERLKFRNSIKLYKRPGFEVLELLVDETEGLYGFSMHFSNGTSATFIRNPSQTDCLKVTLDTPINFVIGDFATLRQEWRVGNKRLYEVGLPGRYNELGQWKPLIYPGNAEPLLIEARTIAEDDFEVQGVVFYMLCTGHRVIEFVVRTFIELPIPQVTFGNRVHLWKCPPLERGQNIYIYDGWLELESIKTEDIRRAIDTINVDVNVLAFGFNVPLSWRLKYNMLMAQGSYATPSQEDISAFSDILQKFPSGSDGSILNYAIDWYIQGKNAYHNVFMRFLCFYVALESVATAVAERNAEFGLGYTKLSKGERDQRKRECIQEMYNRIYADDPLKFVRDAYFDCHESLTDNTKRVVELVFGPDHEYVNDLFKNKVDGYTLSRIRSAIAHGKFVLLDREARDVVSKRVGEMEIICKEFLMRLLCGLKPTERVPKWSQVFITSRSTADPRTTLYTSTDSILPTKDWRIRPEWCE